MIDICQSIVIAVFHEEYDYSGNVSKNYDVITVLHSALMEAKRLVP